MSEQLDWLARNVHDWPLKRGDALFVGRDHHCEGLTVQGTPMGFYPDTVKRITRQQWLDRRAELQNKPNWKDAPEWASWLGQDSSGFWWFFRFEPEVAGSVWDSDNSAFHHSSWIAGAVLGDWRDTLEKRPYISVTGCAAISSGSVGVTVGGPSDLSEPAVTARLQEATDNAPELKSDRYKFERFTSVEDAQPMGEDKHAPELLNTDTLHTIHHAAFLHQGCQLLLNEPELAVFRTADGELLHCKPKECLIDPDTYGLAARLLSDMSGYDVTPEHMRELAEQMGWAV